MIVISIIIVICLIASFIADKEKTRIGVKKGVTMFLNILPTIFKVLIIISIALYFLPNELIVHYLGKDAGALSYVFAALVGSITLMPGFIAYPLASILLKSGVSYAVVAIFINTLMMVGILTLPFEIKYFGVRVAIIRNVLFFFGAIFIGFIIGFIMSI